MQIGFLGLGKMGKNMVFRLLEHKIDVVAWNRSPEPRQEVAEKGAVAVENLSDLVAKLTPPRVIWFMLPSGDLFDIKLAEIINLLTPGDLIIDGGNSYFKESVRRGKELSEKKINFMDIGVSGGPGGARNGACLMIGGSTEDYDRIKPIIEALASPGAYALLGPVGAGHFAKMVHNGIEYGMMQALAEGAAILHKSPFNYDLSKVMDLYNKQSVITSRLVGWAKDAFDKDPELTNISSKIDHTGEGAWTVISGTELGVESPIIEKSLEVRVSSRADSQNFRDKVVSALRGEFGGDPVLKDSNG